MKKNQKLVLLVVLFIGIAMCIVGCNSSDDNSDKETDNEIINKKNVEDFDNNGKISIGDRITLDTESFYVIGLDKKVDKVKLLAEWNINVGERAVDGTKGVQNSLCKDGHCVSAFSDTNYWDENGSPYVYNEQSKLYTDVENYASYLKGKGYSSVSADLIKIEELISLICKPSCDRVPIWLKTGSFWTGSATGSTINSISGGTMSSTTYSNKSGVRPVITISVSEI